MTVAERQDLPEPFLVLATQNPIEQEGTYPLPEAQLDRFLMEINIDCPNQDAERKILFDTTGAEKSRAKPAMSGEDLLSAQRLVRRLPVGESVVEAILALVRSARPGPKAAKSVNSFPGVLARAQVGRRCLRCARVRFLTAASHRPSTTYSNWPSPCSNTAWP